MRGGGRCAAVWRGFGVVPLGDRWGGVRYRDAPASCLGARRRRVSTTRPPPLPAILPQTSCPVLRPSAPSITASSHLLSHNAAHFAVATTSPERLPSQEGMFSVMMRARFYHADWVGGGGARAGSHLREQGFQTEGSAARMVRQPETAGWGKF